MFQFECKYRKKPVFQLESSKARALLFYWEKVRLLFLFRPSTEWMKATHIREDDLFLLFTDYLIQKHPHRNTQFYSLLIISPKNILTEIPSVKVLVAQSYLTLGDPMDSSSPGSSVPGILQAKILEWVAIPISRDQTWVSCIVGRFLTNWAIRESARIMFNQISGHPWLNQVDT